MSIKLLRTQLAGTSNLNMSNINSGNITKEYVDGVINELKASFITTVYTEINKSSDTLKSVIITNLIDENIRLNKRVLEMEDEIDYFHYEVEHLHDRIYDMEIELYESQQQSRRSNLELAGIPNDICDDNLEATCIGILNNLVKECIQPSEVDECYRLPSEGTKTTFIRFLGRKRPDEIKANKDMLNKIELKQFQIPDDTKLHLNDNLPPYYETILYCCRVLRREGKISKMETEDREIKIKLLNGKCWHIIRHKQMLIDLFPDFEFI